MVKPMSVWAGFAMMQPALEHWVLAEAGIEGLFQVAAEATQEAVLDALAGAETTTSRNGHRRVGLADLLGRG